MKAVPDFCEADLFFPFLFNTADYEAQNIYIWSKPGIGNAMNFV